MDCREVRRGVIWEERVEFVVWEREVRKAVRAVEVWVVEGGRVGGWEEGLVVVFDGGKGWLWGGDWEVEGEVLG